MKIDFVEKKLVITQSESKAASVVNSKEYNLIKQVMRDFPDFEVEIKASTKRKSYNRGLTYAYMERYLIGSGDAKRLDEFHGLVQAFGYPEVRHWFLTQISAA